MYPSTGPSVKPPQRLPRWERTVNTALAQTHSIWLCHCDAEFYNQRSLLLLLYSFVYFRDEQLRRVFHTGPGFFFLHLFHLPVSGRQGTSWYFMGTITPHFTHRHASPFCLWHCCFAWRREPGRRLSMRKGLCGAEGVRSDSHTAPGSWQPLFKSCAIGLVRPP